MIRITAYDQVVLRVRDMERMIAFYRDALGLDIVKVQKELGLVHLGAGGTMIDLVDVAGKLGREGGPAPHRDGQNLDHICFRVAEFDPIAIREELAVHGVEAEPPRRRFGAEGYGLSMYLRDPEGNRIELKGPPDETEPDFKEA